MLNKSMRGLSLSLTVATLAASANDKAIAVMSEIPEYDESAPIPDSEIYQHTDKRIRYAQFSPAKRLIKKKQIENRVNRRLKKIHT